MPHQRRPCQPPAGQIPQPDYPLVITGGQLLAIYTKGQTPNGDPAIDQHLGDVLAGGAAARVQDSPAAVTAFAAQRQAAVAVAVERHPHALQVGHPVGGIGHQQLDRARVAEAASDQHRIRHVL